MGGSAGIEGWDGGGAVEELVEAGFEGERFAFEVREEKEGVVEGAEEGLLAAGKGEESTVTVSVCVCWRCG